MCLAIAYRIPQRSRISICCGNLRLVHASELPAAVATDSNDKACLRLQNLGLVSGLRRTVSARQYNSQ